MAGVHLRGNIWYASWRDNNGRSVQRTTGVKAKDKGLTKKQTRELAQAVANKLENLAKGKNELDKAVVQLRAVAEDYGFATPVPTVADFLRDYPRTATGKSEQSRRFTFRLFTEYLGCKALEPVNRITPDDCRGFLRYLLGLFRKGTVGLHRSYLSACFNLAVRQGHMSRNPLGGISVGGEMKVLGLADDTAGRDLLTPDELRICMNPERMGQDWADMVSVCVFTVGARLGDCACLLWENVDFDNATLRFTERKTGQRREVPLCPQLREVLLRRRAGQSEDEPAVFPLFRSRYNSGVSTLSGEFVSLLQANGISGRDTSESAVKGRRHRVNTKSFHSLRHSVVSTLRLNSLLSPDLVRLCVGHKSETVERGYINISRPDQERMLSVLAQNLGMVA